MRISLLLPLLLFSTSVEAQVQRDHGSPYLKMSIEQLMELDVVSVNKSPQKVKDTAAAITVITAEDIRRHGFTSIPEALRLAPGVEVAHIDGNKWAISIRGFNGLYANKLLVMVDGRTVYTPLFSGTYWNIQDSMIEDVATIEVVRGPGGTLWGANAVNGVINIITKHSQNTQGNLLSMGAGNQQRWLAGFRHGGHLGEKAFFRVFAKGFDSAPSFATAANPAFDGWHIPRAGFRVDLEPSSRDQWMLTGEAYRGRAAQRVQLASLTAPYSPIMNDSVQLSGGFIQARGSHRFNDDNELQLQAYMDRNLRHEMPFQEQRTNWDFDIQQHLRWRSHTLNWGAAWHLGRDRIGSSFTAVFLPAQRNDTTYSTFVQDELTLMPGVRMTLGAKFEHNAYTAFEYQPSARLLWQLTEHQTLWLAASRAVQVPSRSFSDMVLTYAVIPPVPLLNPNPTALQVVGNPNVQAQVLRAHELGWRLHESKNFSLDVTAYYHRYDQLVTAEPAGFMMTANPAPLHAMIQTSYGNGMAGRTYGGEVSSTWQLMDDWSLTANYSYLRMRLHLKAGSRDAFAIAKDAGNSPQHLYSLRSTLRLPRRTEFDVAIYHTGRLQYFSSQQRAVTPIPAYNRLDFHLGWQPLHGVEVAFVGQNVLMKQHTEFGSQNGVQVTAVPRTWYAKVNWLF